MKTAAEIAEEAIYEGKMDDADSGADNSGGADNADKSKKEEDAGAGAGSDKGDKGSGDADKGAGKAGADDGDKGTDGKDGKKSDDDEGTFTADDALEVDAPADKPAAPTDNAGIQLSRAEQQHIADNIGEPIVIRGIRGSGDNAKEVELKVYSAQEIPKDFNFSSQADLLSAQNSFQSLERKAQQLLGDYRNNQSAKQAQDFEQRENQGIRDDVADLQKAGDFPKFKIKPGDTGFEDDPAAKQMSEVLNLMTKRNDQYLKEYQQGRPYRHIGFREAHELYQAQQSTKTATKARDDAQADEDKARKGVADKVGTGRGLTTDKVAKPTIPRGTTIDQILARHEAIGDLD